MATTPPYINDAEATSRAQSVVNNNRPAITAEINSKIDLVSTGIKTASPSTTITGDVQIYVLSTAGTYANLGGIVVSSGDLTAGQVQARKIDGVWTKYIAPPAGLDAYATNAKVDPIVSIIDGGEYSTGVSNSSFVGVLSSAGTRSNNEFFSVGGKMSQIDCFTTKLGAIRFKLFKPTEVDGEYEQYWEQSLTTILGANTFIAGTDFTEQQVYQGGFMAFYVNTASGSGATGKIGFISESPGGFVISTSNTPNGTITDLSTTTVGHFALKISYVVNAITDRLDALEQTTAGGANLEGAIGAFEGDSITAGTGTTNAYPFVLQTRFNMGDPVILAKAGTGLVKPSSLGVVGMVNRVNTWEDEANIDFFCIMGMFNDLTSAFTGNPNGLPIGSITDRGTISQPDLYKTASAYGAWDWILNYVQNKYPTIPIVVIIETPRYQLDSINQPTYGVYETDGVTLNEFEKYAQAVAERCNERNIPYLDLYHSSGVFRPWILANNTKYFDQADGIHPNDMGHQILADLIAPFFAQYVFKKKI